jgi:glycosyltransferase involved in cell wall biosynthesis
MRVVINLLCFRPGKVGGAETYLRGLLAHLPLVARDDELIAVCHADNADALDVPGIERVVVGRSDAEIVRARILEAVSSYRAAAAYRVLAGARPDVVLYPQQSLFPKKTDWPAVLTVLDLQHELHPRNFRLSERIFRKCIYGYSLRKADRLIAISESTRKSILRLHNVPPAKVEAIHLGFEPSRHADVDAWPSPRPYLYYPAASFPHKGHIRLLLSVAALKDSGGFPFQLIFTGQKTRHWATIERVIERCGLGEHVRHLGFVDYRQVIALYKGAAAALFPTEFEGFGLPVLEAATLGKKIVLSGLAVFGELGVPAECQIDFAVPQQLRAALADLSPTRLTREPMTWRETAAQTMRVLRSAAN